MFRTVLRTPYSREVARLISSGWGTNRIPLSAKHLHFLFRGKVLPPRGSASIYSLMCVSFSYKPSPARLSTLPLLTEIAIAAAAFLFLMYHIFGVENLRIYSKCDIFDSSLKLRIGCCIVKNTNYEVMR